MEERLFQELRRIEHRIPQQTYKTIIGQIKAGDVAGAEVGIYRLKRRLLRKGEDHHAHSNR